MYHVNVHVYNSYHVNAHVHVYNSYHVNAHVHVYVANVHVSLVAVKHKYKSASPVQFTVNNCTLYIL